MTNKFVRNTSNRIVASKEFSYTTFRNQSVVTETKFELMNNCFKSLFCVFPVFSKLADVMHIGDHDVILFSYPGKLCHRSEVLKV